MGAGSATLGVGLAIKVGNVSTAGEVVGAIVVLITGKTVEEAPQDNRNAGIRKRNRCFIIDLSFNVSC